MSEDQILQKANELDKNDPLKSFRDLFHADDSTLIYLDGNSLGRLPRQTAQHLEKVIYDEWGKDLIDSWNLSWYKKNKVIGDKIGRLIGAGEGEVIVSDNTSINLYKLASAAIRHQVGRETILSDELNFPSDLYVLQGLAKDHQKKLTLLKSVDGMTLDTDAIRSALSQDTALLSLSHVVFKSAFMYDMQEVTEMAHDVGALVLWDLSHAVGSVPINLKEANVDLAIVCTYKYLNGGPGAPAFLYVRKDLQEKLLNPIQGWFGASNPFEFSLEYKAAADLPRFLTGTPPILSMSAIEAGVDMLLQAGMNNVRKKSVRLSEFFLTCRHDHLKELGFELNSPISTEARGSHVSLSHQEAFRINKALMDPSIDGYKIVPDFRAPNNIRFGFAPLYCSFTDITRTIQKLQKIVAEKIYLNYNLDHSAVT